jgi:DNA-directed RNA polymerase subunit RPC12/RpoP
MRRRQTRREQRTQQWEEIAEEALSGFREWRVQHPRATLTEIEAALDERWARVRARVVADAALASAAADLRPVPRAERPVCAGCGAAVELAGQEERTLTTTYNQPIVLERSATACPACGRRVFPPGRGGGAAAQE